MTDDLFHIYVDFNKILSTNSPDDAVALTLAMFSIFELAFEKNGRVLRFLYAILFGDKRYLSNATRNLMREKSINMYAEVHPKLPDVSHNDARSFLTNRPLSPAVAATSSHGAKTDGSTDIPKESNGATAHTSNGNDRER